MIIFDLECLNGHMFEGWFEDRKDFENQQEQGMIECPVCESTCVVQKLSPVSVRTSSSAAVSMRDHQAALEELTQKVTEYVEKNFEDVGSKFSEQALKMHYGVTEYKNIRGTTTMEDEKILKQEGVPVFKIPVMKKSEEDLN